MAQARIRNSNKLNRSQPVKKKTAGKVIKGKKPAVKPKKVSEPQRSNISKTKTKKVSAPKKPAQKKKKTNTYKSIVKKDVFQ